MQQALRDNTPIPDAIANAPDLQDGLDLYLNAFIELSTCRPPDGYIPWTAIVDYCRAYEFDRELIDETLVIIRRVDQEIQEFRYERAKKKAQAVDKNRTRGNG